MDNHSKFENFIKKVLELQKQKEQDQDQLSEEALWEIAQAMGLDESDLQTAKQNYLDRGNQHLKHHNWEFAKKEFEDLLKISPKNLAGTFGLANVYADLWELSKNESDKLKAQVYAEKSLRIDPNFKEAYALINRLNKAPQNNQQKKPSHKEKTERKTSRSKPGNYKQALGLIGFILLMVSMAFGIVFYTMRGQMFGVPTDLEPDATQLISTKQGSVCWLLFKGTSMGDGIKESYQAKIINPETGKTLKWVPLIQNMDFMEEFRLYQFDNRILNFNPESLTLKLLDPLTGELQKDFHQELATIKELSAGIADIRIDDDDIFQFDITCKNNRKYYYAPKTKELSQKKIWPDKENKVARFFWDIPWEEHTQHLVYNKVMANPVIKASNLRHQPDDEVIAKSKNTFIEPKLLFSHQDFCIIIHNSEAGKGAKKTLTAIDKTGIRLWDHKNIQSKALTYERHPATTPSIKQSVLHKKTLVIDSKADENAVLGIDTESGNILWEYKY